MKDTTRTRGLVITQDLLAAFYAIKQEKDEADRRYEEVRERVLELDRSGAVAESGPLTCRIKHREGRHLSGKELSRVLGKAEAERLRSLMPVTRSASVRVAEQDSR